MWYDFESKFTFGDSKNTVDVEFSHCSGRFVISVQIDENEKITHCTGDENEAKKLFSTIFTSLQSIQAWEIKK